MNQYLDNIDNNIAEKHLLKHAFYLAWARGELSKDALTDYAQQYYHHVAAFPTYLSAVHSNCEDQAIRKQLLDNLIDEEAGSPNHPDLWKEFAQSLSKQKGKKPYDSILQSDEVAGQKVQMNRKRRNLRQILKTR